MYPKYNAKKVKAAVTALKNYNEKPFVRHEWEELVLRLSLDNDPQLREKMYREMDDILEKDPGFKIFRKL